MGDTLRLGTSPKKLDLELIEHGAKREAPMAPGVVFHVLPWGVHNPRYKRALQKRAQKDATEGNLPKGETIQDVGRSYMMARQEDPEFIVDALIADVEGILNERGNPVQYTRERGLQILSDPEWVHLRDWIVGESFSLAGTYKKEVEASGNGSRPASSGKRGGAAKSRKTKSS